MILKECLLKRRWIAVAAALACATIAFASYVLYRELYNPNSPHNLRSRYSFLFRPVQDVDFLSDQIQSKLRRLPVNNTEINSTSTCSLHCTDAYQPPPNGKYGDSVYDQPLIPSSTTFDNLPSKPDIDYSDEDDEEVIFKGLFSTLVPPNPQTSEGVKVSKIRRLDPTRFQGQTTPFASPGIGRVASSDDGRQYSYHGCCISYQEVISPDRLKNVENEWRRLIQFKSERQYFLTDICRHVNGCQRQCRCEQQEIIAFALVVDDDEGSGHFDEDSDIQNARVEFVKFPGWCKCFND